jgi:serralysin
MKETPMAIVNGNGNNETLPGTEGADIIFAAGGHDTLVAKGGNDLLFGQEGNDTLTGGAGVDTMTGGADRDAFDFNSAGETTGDRISDFTQGLDKIDLGSIDAKSFSLFQPSSFGNNAFAFKGDLTNVALGKGDLGFFHQNGLTQIRGNTDGDAQFEVSFTLSGIVNLTGNDFAL